MASDLSLIIEVDRQGGRLMEKMGAALAESGLDALALETFVERLLRVGGRLFETEPLPSANGKVSCGLMMRLTPYAELAMRDVIDIAKSPRTPSGKALRIGQVLTLAGF